MKFIKRCESSGDDGKNETNEPRLCWRCRYGTGLDKQNNPAKNCDFFLTGTHKFKNMFWVIKRTVSLKRFF